MWVLRHMADEAAQTFRILPGGMKTIGRATRADFILDVDLVSRLHCRLVAGPRGLEVEDLDSTNGTFVNDRRVRKALLVPGDRLRLGRAVLTVAHEPVRSDPVPS